LAYVPEEIDEVVSIGGETTWTYNVSLVHCAANDADCAAATNFFPRCSLPPQLASLYDPK
jgi:hypothetical protein